MAAFSRGRRARPTVAQDPGPIVAPTGAPIGTGAARRH
jgi:hypothetical protein